jgi:sporulation protein YqfC
MKKEGPQWRRAKEYEFLGESLSKYPLVEIAGNKRVIVENHMGIVKYGAQEIGVKVRDGKICVSGVGLEIACIAKDKLVIYGRIEGVCLYNGGD